MRKYCDICGRKSFFTKKRVLTIPSGKNEDTGRFVGQISVTSRSLMCHRCYKGQKEAFNKSFPR